MKDSAAPKQLSLFSILIGLMQLFMRIYLLGHRIRDLLILLRLILHKPIVIDIDDLPLVLTQPLHRHIHLPMSRAIIHLKRESLDIPHLIGQHSWFLSHNLRKRQPSLILPHPIDHPISLILDHPQILPLLDDPLLLVPPLNRLIHPIHLILPLVHIPNLAHNHKQFLVTPHLISISNVLCSYPLVVQHKLMVQLLELFLLFEEGVEE